MQCATAPAGLVANAQPGIGCVDLVCLDVVCAVFAGVCADSDNLGFGRLCQQLLAEGVVCLDDGLFQARHME